ncbi:Leucine-rich repeat protein kinase family protein, putative isoform 1 [Cinnamomum micranthum f. kanehirae]|uniref:Leucine-rich repeat protein kinase family protein, putative isoform 1 n=1 Tax=Cinnamomum micranthum f. kanehirae TaxID=337451 RepID=A0A3S3N5R4_9MAGN|nr:Leucine-rich repeat protein kinase family protein, putative isoform 1 [Cinnamomum micranthum f. kanehirae]
MMDWRLGREGFGLSLGLFLVLSLTFQNSWCLNSEGLALLQFRERVERDPYGALLDWDVDDDDPCSWFGVGCLFGQVEILNLKDLCLEGTLTPALGALRHIRSLILRNNSFSGIIPREIGELKELEVLDLGCNNLSGPLPSELGNILPLKMLLLGNNNFFGTMPPELHKLSMHSEIHVGENMLPGAANGASCNEIFSTRYIDEPNEFAGNRRLLQNEETGPASPSPPPTRSRPPSRPPSISVPPSPSPSPSPAPASTPASTNDLPSPAPAIHPTVAAAPPSISSPIPSPSTSPQQSDFSKTKSNTSHVVLLSVIAGVSVLSTIVVVGFYFCRNSKVVTVRPWTTGLSGQLQKAFVTGVPSLKRSELETACEDFSNIIGTSSDGTVYKGTLSSGVEIAVLSTAVTSAKEWSKHAEGQFRKKIDTLSKVNHKNFVSLLGYCEEEEPFTRMMVFEYAPNGTLFEHLHIREAEHLDWGMRLRIAMGMAYCLEHMHQLNPPVIHTNVKSTTVCLTDDYAAKISDFSFWNKTATLKISSGDAVSLESSDADGCVYSFGLILLEMMTGKLPNSDSEDPLVEWASDYLRGVRPVKYMMDPTLKSFKEEEAVALCTVILSCMDPNPRLRPTMREVAAGLRQITALAPDGASPRLSPLWWAELEVLSSSEAS